MTTAKRKHRLLFVLVFLPMILLTAVFLFMKSPISNVSLKHPDFQLELGDSLKKSPDYYLEGNSLSVALSYVDSSAVKNNTAGQYPITIYHGFDKYTCTITVSDTTAPQLLCDINTKTVLPGEVITIDKLGIRTQDYSEIKYIGFTKLQSDNFYTGLSDDEMLADMYASYREGIHFYSEEFQFTYGGIYELTIAACDIFENKSEITISLKVEEPPVIEVPTDFYVAVGSDITYANYLTAWDFIDEKFTCDDVEIDSSSVSLATAGDYPVLFRGTDTYGLTSTTTATVHVLAKKDLQQKINSHEINVSEHIIIGAYNLYDSGYYQDIDKYTLSSYLLPSIVHVKNPWRDTSGSGFIVSIDDSTVTIATCAHVITQCLAPTVTFYDGTQRSGICVGQDYESDIAFIRIPIDGSSENTSISSDYVKNLRTVHIDEAYWKSLDNNASIPLWYACINGSGHLWHRSSGTLLEKDIKRDWNSYEDVHQMHTTMEAKSGSSGSAIFDESGRLFGMVRGSSTLDDGSTVKVGVPLSEILRQYELTFKKKVQYR